MMCLRCSQRLIPENAPEYGAFMDFLKFHVDKEIKTYTIAGECWHTVIYKGFPSERIHYECPHCGMEWDVIT